MPFQLTFTGSWIPSPMSYWVHTQPGGQIWIDAVALRPSPCPVPGRGWPRLHVEVRGLRFEFASLAEIDHFMDIMSRKHLPTPAQLARGREATWNWGRANSHWLSRLPAKAKSWTFRAKALPVLRRARAQLADVLQA